MKSLFGAVFVLVAAAGSAQAERFSAIDGTKFVSLCTNRDKNIVADCTSYINGVSDSVSFYQNLRPADGSKGEKLPDYICVPVATTGPQMRDVVVSWAKAHPDKMSLQASGVVVRALNDKYPCRGEPQPK